MKGDVEHNIDFNPFYKSTIRPMLNWIGGVKIRVSSTSCGISATHLRGMIFLVSFTMINSAKISC